MINSYYSSGNCVNIGEINLIKFDITTWWLIEEIQDNIFGVNGVDIVYKSL